VGRPRSGREYTNARMRPARWRKVPTYRENRGWNRQDAKSAKVFLLFLLPFAPLRLCGSDLRDRQAGRPRMGREYTNARMRPARWRKVPTYRENRGWNRQDAKSAKVFFFSFPLRPLRLCGSDLQDRQAGRPRSGREYTNARIGGCPAAGLGDAKRFIRGCLACLARCAESFDYPPKVWYSPAPPKTTHAQGEPSWERQPVHR